MAYKSIVTVASSVSERLPALLDRVGQIAQATDAHLDALALGVDRTQIGYSYVGTGGVFLQIAQDKAEADARAVEQAIKAALKKQGPTLRWASEAALTQLGALTELVSSRLRFADLVVLGLPYGPGRGAEEEAVLETALFDAKAPVLVLPDADNGRDVAHPKHVVLAWNQSQEALAAARAAMPLLQQAKMVSVTVIDPPTHGPERSDPGGLLCQMLVRHGVRAEVVVLAKSTPRVSDTLVRHVLDVDADLLVMGAYGHSRFREFLLGGATRDMLENATIPVLMAH
jgi:nucleotide-binding universal stress UspA family protein